MSTENNQPAGARTTRWLFVDMNSYFASVEQQLQPRLRGKPIAVVPTLVETTCCIAASYEAKAFGIKTGTAVHDARELCPGIQFVVARVEEYVRFHEEIIKAVESVLPVHQVLSIDEMSCKLRGPQREAGQAIELAEQVKQAIRSRVGRTLRCSVGLAPNRLLAKVASNLQKPDGLTLIRKEELPERLHGMELDDFPGIATGMKRRLHRAGIFTVEQLCRQSQDRLAFVWGGVVGQRWWHWLRGDDLYEKPTQRRTVGHSHVLPPELRSHEAAYGVLVKLIHKAAARLRGINYWAGQMVCEVDHLQHHSWRMNIKLGDIQDTPTMLNAFAAMWAHRPTDCIPYRVSITLHDLKSSRSCALPLFVEQQKRQSISQTMDQINNQLGSGALHLGSMNRAHDVAPDRISFQYAPKSQPPHPSTVRPKRPATIRFQVPYYMKQIPGKQFLIRKSPLSSFDIN